MDRGQLLKSLNDLPVRAIYEHFRELCGGIRGFFVVVAADFPLGQGRACVAMEA